MGNENLHHLILMIKSWLDELMLTMMVPRNL
jgi:hypothetical protein